MAHPRTDDNKSRVKRAIEKGWHNKSDIHLHLTGKPKLKSSQIEASIALLLQREEIMAVPGKNKGDPTEYYLSLNDTAMALTRKPWNSHLFLGGSTL